MLNSTKSQFTHRLRRSWYGCRNVARLFWRLFVHYRRIRQRTLSAFDSIEYHQTDKNTIRQDSVVRVQCSDIEFSAAKYPHYRLVPLIPATIDEVTFISWSFQH